jgi:hypothetical protein
MLVQVLKLLPQKARERFCYVSLAVLTGVIVYGLWRAPEATAVGSGGFTLMLFLARLLNR